MSYKKQQNQVISHYSYKFTPFPTIKEHKLLKDPKKNFTKKSLEILSEMSSELPSEMPSENNCLILLLILIFLALSMLLLKIFFVIIQ